ncbi:hypothetical protein BGY98DRAFT_185758 [Russula aff. rugulosa BPL654]|nr:hypothetical protein BGY98DRAFT_185758 [Russula aff. rugulosa BPL654]
MPPPLALWDTCTNVFPGIRVCPVESIYTQKEYYQDGRGHCREAFRLLRLSSQVGLYPPIYNCCKRAVETCSTQVVLHLQDLPLYLSSRRRRRIAGRRDRSDVGDEPSVLMIDCEKPYTHLSNTKFTLKSGGKLSNACPSTGFEPHVLHDYCAVGRLVTHDTNCAVVASTPCDDVTDKFRDKRSHMIHGVDSLARSRSWPDLSRFTFQDLYFLIDFPNEGLF